MVEEGEGAGFAREVLGGVERLVSSSGSQERFRVEPRDFALEDTSHFEYGSSQYRLRHVRRDAATNRFTLTLVRAKLGYSDVRKRLGYFTEDHPADRVEIGEPSHDGSNFVISFAVPEIYSSQRVSYVILDLMKYLLGRRVVLERKAEKKEKMKQNDEEQKKLAEQRRKGKKGKRGIFPETGGIGF